MMKNSLFGMLILVIQFYPGSAQDQLPSVNQRIINYVDGVIGIRVGRGECWDLADEALMRSGAKFDKSSKETLYIFGRKYDHRKEPILPGDIIQFQKVIVKYQKGNTIITETMAHHTAIVYEIRENHKMNLAHQNTSRIGKKVGISEFDLNHIQKGKLYFYRPIPSD